MSAIREAAQAALEALEKNVRWRHDYDDYGGYAESDLAQENSAAVVALRAALAEPEPQGEPVAWVDDLSLPHPRCVTDLLYCSTREWDQGDHLKYTPLYTAPPAPKREPQVERLQMLIRRSRVQLRKWSEWYGSADHAARGQLPLPPAGDVELAEDISAALGPNVVVEPPRAAQEQR